MISFFISIGFISLTVVMYIFAKWLYEKYPSPFLLPITTATVLIIILLLMTQLDYETYMIGGKWIHALLGPAVVALAYPLYIHREVLVKYRTPILLGSVVGALVGIISGVGLARIFQFEDVLVMSLAPKSVTTAVAMELSSSLNGQPGLAAVFVTIAGITGVMLSGVLYRIFCIRTVVGRGVGIGSASHAIGTAKAMESGFFEGSIATVAMIINAIVVSIVLPYLILIM